MKYTVEIMGMDFVFQPQVANQGGWKSMSLALSK